MAKASRWLPIFEAFVRDLRISSKEVTSTDERGVKLDLWESQKRFLSEIATGLDDDIRTFICLKSRQLGITTISLAIDVFWLAMHPNLTGALVSDTDKNRNKNRAQIERYVKSLPDGYFGESFTIVKSNINFTLFSNGSRLDYLVAGTKAKGTSWGEGEGYAFAHLTECAAYGDAQGLASFEESFAQTNPDRLYIYESTAKGFNHFRDKYLRAKEEQFTKKAFFIGWWASNVNRIERKDPRFEKFGNYKPAGEERDLVLMVRTLYGYNVSPEQLAWIRWKPTDTSADDPNLLDQNQPWVENQAFVMTGHSFFQTRIIAQDMRILEESDIVYKGYAYEYGNDFFQFKMYECGEEERDQIELKVWEEPAENGKYVIGADPAYGRNDHKDKHVASVWRCYSDKIVQVAEFATSEVEAKHFAWVLAHMASAYRDCIVNLEIGGPGRMIMLEWEHLRGMLKAEMYAQQVRQMGWDDAMDQARWYLYHRPDAMGAGYAANFECLALDTRLPTPSGWSTMRDLEEGDYLLSDTGQPTKVIGVSDIKVNSVCYEIKFDDGTVIVADENHWWKVARRHWKGAADKLRQTKQLEAKKFYIRKSKPLQLPKTELRLDPYLLGVWLGDGTSANASVSCGDQDIEEMVANIEACGQPTTQHRYKTCWRIGLSAGKKGHGVRNDFLDGLRELGVLNNKHIPKAYLRASFDQRLSLLQGLMDTDGSATANGGSQCEFVTNRPKLAMGFAELVRSLGFKAKSLTCAESVFYKEKIVDCPPRIQFWFTTYPEMPVFRLKRKVAGATRTVRTKRFEPCHRIESIRQVESVPVKCVMVDGPTKMFLAGDGMIPTHNTTFRTKSEIMHQMRGAYATRELDIKSMYLLGEMSVVIQDGSEIGAPESRSENCKDDRVFACALANRAWLNWVRPTMLAEGLTFARVNDQETGVTSSLTNRLNEQVFRFFKNKEEAEDVEPERGPKWLVDRGLI